MLKKLYFFFQCWCEWRWSPAGRLAEELGGTSRGHTGDFIRKPEMAQGKWWAWAIQCGQTLQGYLRWRGDEENTEKPHGVQPPTTTMCHWQQSAQHAGFLYHAGFLLAASGGNESQHQMPQLQLSCATWLLPDPWRVWLHHTTSVRHA